MNKVAATVVSAPRVVRPSQDALKDVISTLAIAATGETSHPYGEIEKLLPRYFPILSARIVIFSEGRWSYWDAQQDGEDKLAFLRSGRKTGEKSVRIADDLAFFPIHDESVGLLVHLKPGAHLPEHELFVCSRFLETAVSRSISPPSGPSRYEVISAFSQIANTILKSGDLAEIFFNITRVGNSELAADICGIMLLDGEHLVMQRCVGNDSAATAALRMKAGQGVAGQVLQTGEPCAVENYLSSSHISQDFFDLARVERVRSALAVPLFSQNEIVGVLEVWRRRPSIFTRDNIAELTVLADLASLAIANTKLIDAQKQAMRELKAAHVTISQRVDMIENAADLQTKLVTSVIVDNGLQEIVWLAARETGASVYICDQKLETRAQGGDAFLGGPDLNKLRMELAAVPRDDMSAKAIKVGADGATIYAQRLSAVSGQLGWALLVGFGASRDSALLALAAISMSVALFDAKAQAATSVLSEKFSTLLWDLIDAPRTVRALAVEKLRELGKELKHATTVILCGIDNPAKDTRNGHAEWDFDIRRRLVNDLLATEGAGRNATLMASFKGNELAFVVSTADPKAVASFVGRLEDEIRRTFPNARRAIGVSASRLDLLLLPDALREARLAKKVAEMTSKQNAILFEDIGLLGLIMGLQEGVGFGDFAGKVMKAIADDTHPQSQTLRETLKAFLASNCSQREAAEALSVHPKTVAYRIERIEELCGLSLRNHEHRILLELAMKVHDLGIATLKS